MLRRCTIALVLSLVAVSARAEVDLVFGLKSLASKLGLADIRLDRFKKLLAEGKTSQAIAWREENIGYFKSLPEAEKAIAYAAYQKYSILQINDLLSAGKPEAALRYFRLANERESLGCDTAAGSECETARSTLVSYYYGRLTRKLLQCQRDAHQPDEIFWASTKTCIDSLSDDVELLSAKGFSGLFAPLKTEFGENLSRLKNELVSRAPANYEKYGFLREPSFFQVYPVALSKAAITGLLPDEQLLNLGRVRFLEFIEKNPGVLPTERGTRLGKALLADSGRSPMDVIERINLAIRLNKIYPAGQFKIPAILHLHASGLDGSTKFTFASTDRIKRSSISPEDLIRAAAAASFDDPSDIFFYTYVKQERRNLKEISEKYIESSSVVGSLMVSNPEYEQALQNYYNKKNTHERAVFQQSNATSNSLIGALSAALAVQTQSDFQEAQRLLQVTPKTVRQESRDQYRFILTNYELERLVTIGFVAVDKSTGRRCVGDTNFITTSNFLVETGLKPSDITYRNAAANGWLSADAVSGAVKMNTNQPLSAVTDKVLQACRGVL